MRSSRQLTLFQARCSPCRSYPNLL